MPCPGQTLACIACSGMLLRKPGRVLWHYKARFRGGLKGFCALLCSQYEPELFPGLIYRMKDPKVVLLIFVSGKVVLTGARAALFSIHRLVICACPSPACACRTPLPHMCMHASAAHA